MKRTTYNFKLATNRGQALSVAAIFFLIISLTVVLGVVTPVVNQVESVRSLERGAQSLYAAEGVSQDVMYRLIKGMPVNDVETLTYGSFSAAATTTAASDGKEIIAAGNRDGFLRKSKVHLRIGSGASFNYGIQAGVGGILLENSSQVRGSAFSTGPVEGAGNFIRGDVVSAGPSGRIDNVHATSSAYAHTIKDATVDKDAYYQVISNTTVLGALHPGSPDVATSSLPITDSQIGKWESDAQAGGVVSSPCPYKITADTAIGPKKIACDLEITGSPTVTLGGVVWVTGNITIKNSPVIQVSASLAGKSVGMIADNPANRTTGSKIDSNNSAFFSGAGAGSYVALISQNNSAEQGGNEEAINVDNTAHGAFLVYAGHGEIELSNTISLKEVTAYRIHLRNSAEVIYETGLVSALFSSGPAGGYVFDNWREVE